MKKLIIDVGAIRSNLAAVRKMTGSALLIADLSCDAHGLGLLSAASVLRDEGVRAFAVSEVEDAERLRRNGFVDQQILILRSTVDAQEIDRACDVGAICTVGSLEAAIAVNSAAQARSTVIEVRLKVDSGPGQYGFLPSEPDKLLQVYQRLSNLAVSGIYTRLPGARAGKKVILERMEAFESLLVKLDDAGVDLGMTQALDSYSLFKCDLDRLDAVCVGSALTGRTPGLGNQLARVGFVEASIDELKWLPADTVVGEGRGKKLKKSTKAAVVPVGWFNGIGRPAPSLRNPLFRFLFRKERINVTKGGKRLRLLGPVCEDYMLLDMTELDCGVGDTVCIEADPRTVKGIPVEYRT